MRRGFRSESPWGPHNNGRGLFFGSESETGGERERDGSPPFVQNDLGACLYVSLADARRPSFAAVQGPANAGPGAPQRWPTGSNPYPPRTPALAFSLTDRGRFFVSVLGREWTGIASAGIHTARERFAVRRRVFVRGRVSIRSMVGVRELVKERTFRQRLLTSVPSLIRPHQLARPFVHSLAWGGSLCPLVSLIFSSVAVRTTHCAPRTLPVPGRDALSRSNFGSPDLTAEV